MVAMDMETMVLMEVPHLIWNLLGFGVLVALPGSAEGIHTVDGRNPKQPPGMYVAL